LEYFINTWHIILHDMEEYCATCPRIKMKMDAKMGEKLKWMKG
jgi:hypothetical protein